MALCGVFGAWLGGQIEDVWKHPHAVITQYFPEGQGQGNSAQAPSSFYPLWPDRNFTAAFAFACYQVGGCCLSASKQPCLEPQV